MRIIALLFLFNSSALFAQWEPQDIPLSGRYDDVFFINEQEGWAVGGPQKTIYQTTDGGQTWQLQFTSPQSFDYLRSVEFANAQLGFVGSLSSRLYMTEDGGNNWQDITNRVPFETTYLGQPLTQVPGICGLSAPSEQVIYGCGIWNGGPAYVIKSTDGGQTWSTTHLSDKATQLVDILFLDENEGFVTGRANPIEKGGIIMHTTDGGATWTEIHTTNTPGDYIWKIQTPDSVNFFGSIQSLPSTNNVRFVKSTNQGMDWQTLPVHLSHWNYIQMIGFSDALTGWTGGTASSANGGETALYHTTDGGLTWTRKAVGSASTFNRFFMVNEDVVFVTGTQVYKYNPAYVPDGLPKGNSIHNLKILPNPNQGVFKLVAQIGQETRCEIEIIDTAGRPVAAVYQGVLASGDHTFSVEVASGQMYIALLHTNEGLNYTRISAY